MKKRGVANLRVKTVWSKTPANLQVNASPLHQASQQLNQRNVPGAASTPKNAGRQRTRNNKGANHTSINMDESLFESDEQHFEHLYKKFSKYIFYLALLFLVC